MLLAVTPAAAVAQQLGTVQGTVVDATTMQPLPGAQVSVVGTGRGILTNPQGRFNIVNVPAGNQVVRVNLIGYGQAEQAVAIPAGAAVTVDFAIRQSALTLEGVVVTALGIEREARTLGVAAQSLRPEQLPRVEPNIVNAFTGRVAGVNVTATGPQGGSARIVIRGENSITGNNQPLFIVDGIPIDNQGPGVLHHGQGGFDYGNMAQDLNPDLIESITVLKGPNAAALYGSRASNGVILITTRKGAGGRAAEVMVSQTTSYESPLRLPRYQNQFGQGSEGLFSFWDGWGGGINDGTDESWGPPLDIGLMIPQWNSPVTDAANRQRQPLPWVSNPNNVRDFFDPGLTNNTTVSIASAGERMSGRFSASRFGQDAMVPGQRLDRVTLSFGGMMEATERLDLNTSVQFIQ
jgi:TonB-dependent SusC/RagA subfamily outer membrane receptor